MPVVYVKNIVAILLSSACKLMPFALISWFSTSVQYSDWFGVYTKLKIQPNRKMENMPTPEMAFEGVVVFATCEDMPATRARARALASEKDPQTKLWGVGYSTGFGRAGGKAGGLTVFVGRSSRLSLSRLLHRSRRSLEC